MDGLLCLGVLHVQTLQDVPVEHVHLLQDPLAGGNGARVPIRVPLVDFKHVGDLEDELVTCGIREAGDVAFFVPVQLGQEGLPYGESVGHPLVKGLEGEGGETVGEVVASVFSQEIDHTLVLPAIYQPPDLQ